MYGTIIRLLFGLSLVSIIYAQEGDFIESDNLPDGWELYQFEFEDDLTGYLPVLIDRNGFLEQTLQMDTEEEEGKFILRITYNYKNQLYYFLMATRGEIEGINELNGDELQELLNKKLTEVNSALLAEGFMQLSGAEPQLTDVTSNMKLIISIPKYFIKGEELIFFIIEGYQKKALRLGQDSTDEVNANIEIIDKNFSWHVEE